MEIGWDVCFSDSLIFAGTPVSGMGTGAEYVFGTPRLTWIRQQWRRKVKDTLDLQFEGQTIEIFF